MARALARSALELRFQVLRLKGLDDVPEMCAVDEDPARHFFEGESNPPFPVPNSTFPSYQGCGLGLDVSVSRRSRDVSTSRLGLVSVSAINVSCPRPILCQILQVTIIKLIKSVVAVNKCCKSLAELV